MNITNIDKFSLELNNKTIASIIPETYWGTIEMQIHDANTYWVIIDPENACGLKLIFFASISTFKEWEDEHPEVSILYRGGQ